MSLISFVFAFSVAHQTVAQDLPKFDANKNNYIVVTKKVQQLKPISMASDEMKTEDGADYGQFEIVFCGKDIPQLTDKERMSPYLEMLNKGGVKLIACGFSLKKFGVDQTLLPKEIEIVENGIAYSLKLKKKGFIGIDL